MIGLALSFTPALAQRGGGGRSGGGHSSSVSRSSSSSSSSRSFSGSSSRSSSSYSSPSRSSSSRSSSSYSSPSRSTSSRSSYASPSRSTSSRSSYAGPSRSSSSRSNYAGPSRSSSSRSGSIGSPDRSRGAAVSRDAGVSRGADVRAGAPGRESTVRGGGAGVAGPRGSVAGAPAIRPTTGRPSASPAARSGGYARPGHPGPLPPSSRPIHPAPYFYHPWHGYVVHCHPIFWDPLPLRPLFWPGFWLYCNSYWYDYHVTDVVVVRRYVQDTYNVDMVTYGISGDVMYAIVRDDGDTYLQVYDKDDHLLAEQKINKKYCNLVIDAESGGCWISKKHDKDPLLFLWADGQLLIYEAD